MTAAPAALASACDLYSPPVRLMYLSAKFTLPIALPMGGMMMSLTIEVTILPNAPPMMMPTAMSTTLPRIANSLNSLTIPMTLLLSSVGLFAELVGQSGVDRNVVALAAGGVAGVTSSALADTARLAITLATHQRH